MNDSPSSPLSRTFSEKKIQKRYALVAWFYDFWSWVTESKAARRVLALAAIQDGEAVLEVAVGTGLVFEKVVGSNPHGVNEGIDIAPAMLNKARQRLEKKHLSNYHLQQGSAYQLPYPDQQFDVVLNNFMLDLLPETDFPKVLSEFYRVLKPGGRVVISTFAFPRKWYHNIWSFTAKYFPALLTGCRPVSLAPWLTASGFKPVTSEFVSQNTFPAEILRAEKSAVL